jgi:hypothetical protein
MPICVKSVELGIDPVATQTSRKSDSGGRAYLSGQLSPPDHQGRAIAFAGLRGRCPLISYDDLKSQVQLTGAPRNRETTRTRRNIGT